MNHVVAAAASLMMILCSSLSISAEVPFDQSQFDAMRAAGKPVAVVFHADWCPTCRAQAPVLKRLMQSPALRSLTLYVADFDTQKALERSLRVTQQSTIVVFKDGKEVARSTGETQQPALSALLERAVS